MLASISLICRANVSTKRGEIIMKAIIVTDRTAGTTGMKLAERPKPPAAINDVIVQISCVGIRPD